MATTRATAREAMPNSDREAELGLVEVDGLLPPDVGEVAAGPEPEPEPEPDLVAVAVELL